jgi:hypothetical protein
VDEKAWAACGNPEEMLRFFQDNGKRSERKLRLFAVACCRRIWQMLTEEGTLEAVEVAERYADGLASCEELESAWMAAAYAADHAEQEKAPASACGAADDDPWLAAREASALAAQAGPVGLDAEQVAQAHIFRDLFDPVPFRPVTLPESTRTWNNGLIQRLAEAAYENRLLPAGHLDPERLAVLADAMEEAGADAGLVEHLRGPGPHVRGCVVVDLLTGRE